MMMDGKDQESTTPAARSDIMLETKASDEQPPTLEGHDQQDVANKESPSCASEDGQAEEKLQGDGSSFKYFLRVFTYNDRKGWLMNIVAGFCMIAGGTALPLMDVIFGQAVDAFNDFAIGNMSPAGYRSEVAKYSLYFVYLFVGKFALTYTWTFLINVTAIRTTKQLRIDFVKQMLRQEIPFFDNPTSSLSGQVTTNGNLITLGISEKFGLIIEGIATFFAAFVVAFVVQWKLALIVISIVPVNIIVSVVCIIFDTIYEYQMFEIYGKAGSIAEEAFSTIRTAHAFWAFPKLSNRYNRILEDAAKVGAKKSLIYAILFPTEFFCIFAAYALAFWQGMRMFSNGEVTVGTVVTVIFAVLVAAQALTQIAPQTIVISKATAAASDLFSIIDRSSKIDALSDAGDKPKNFRGNISFENVQFEYPSRPDVPVLRKLTLDIPADKTTALVGASGSGKSTVCGLLERWYVPSGGRITLDSQPIEDLNLQWLRTNIRLVQQEPTLFSGSIYQNVVDGLSGTDMISLPEEEKRRLVEESCQAAYAHDFISELPQGYDTVIGERGASLSGGQKQRVVIARSIISNPKVLLLDEATSALDPRAEKIVQQALNNVAKDRTMVVIAHRLSTIRDADNIIVLSKGDIIEHGTHDELVKLDRAYARLIRTQDLGHSSAEAQDEEEPEDHSEDDKPVAQVSTAASASAETAEGKDSEGYSLLSGMLYIHKEQSKLWLSFLVTYLSSIAGGATYPALAILFSKTMEAFETVDVGKANFFALMFFVVACGNLVAYAVAGWTANIIAQHIMKFYRSELFNNTLRQDMIFFDKPEHSTGSLVSRLSTEPTSLQELMSMNLALIVVNVTNVLSSAVVAIAYGWKLGLVLVFGALPVLVGSGYLRIRLEYKFENDTAHRFAQSSGKASEAVMAIRTVSSLALERAVVERYRSSLDGIAKKAIGGLGWRMFFYSLTQSVSFLCMGLGFWYGGQLVSTGEYTNGQFYTVFVAVLFSGQAAAMFFSYSTSVSKAKTAINYIFALRHRKTLSDMTTEDDDFSDKAVSEHGMSVDVNSISFAYPLRPKLQVLKNIDVSIKAGQMIAFVGASGCGKSTIIALLERFYDPVSGQLRMDEKDIKTMHRQHLRSSIALVQQEPVLYQGSIRDNIGLGVENEEPDDDAITEAYRQANAWEFVSSLPEGLSTPCGSQGFSLSGGQRQRIAIARALIRRPRLLLLDEATSALDTESEKVVKEALDRAAAGRTTIAVAHRLSTIRDADLIIVFDRGGIAQMGTHEELIAKRGLYYEMVLGQSLDREAA